MCFARQLPWVSSCCSWALLRNAFAQPQQVESPKQLLLMLLLPCRMLNQVMFCTCMQAHVVSRDGSDQLLAAFDDQPSYAQLQEALKAWPDAALNKSLLQRLQDEARWVQDLSLIHL